MKKKHFLKTICPFRVLEERVTWGQFIVLHIKGLLGAALCFGYYMLFIIAADLVEVIK
jgi:hypothetical protein